MKLTFSTPIALALLGASINAQAPAPRQLSLTQDLRVETTKVGDARELSLAVAPDGRMIIAPKNGWNGNVLAFDAAGAALPWKLSAGYGDKADIGMASRAGWVGGSGQLWLGDPRFKEVALVDDKGQITKSIEFPSWIHPHWAERRQYPLFRQMEPLAVYADTTMLILPSNERSFISTPSFDKSVKHLLRVSPSGAIERAVATLPATADARGMDNKIFIQSQRSMRVFAVPFMARSYWGVSTDGQRIAIVSPGSTDADSGAIHVTMLGERGDTVFNRRYPYIAARVPKDAADKYLAQVNAVGDIPAQRIRDSIAKFIPVFQSFVTGLVVGQDHSAWIMLKPATDTSKERRALVLDPRGDVVGMATIPPDREPAAATLDHLWAFEIGRMHTPVAVVRYSVRPATGAPPARTSKASTSPTPSSPPR